MDTSKTLYTALFMANADDGIKALAEACGVAADQDMEEVILNDPYPAAHTSSDGRMMDYGTIKSDSHEGRMTKAKLSRIAAKAQSLHDRLLDGDDLPEWVQDKITTSEDRISSAYNYIDYKLSRIMGERD